MDDEILDYETIMDLSIPFPTIEGVSNRQEWYANCLREEYVRRNEERFRMIDEAMQVENDRRMRCNDEYNYMCGETFSIEYSNAEMACLFGIDAGGVIAALKEALYSEGE